MIGGGTCMTPSKALIGWVTKYTLANPLIPFIGLGRHSLHVQGGASSRT